MRKVLFTVLLCSLAVIAYAVPARRTTKLMRQSDGTYISAQLVGDEHLHYYRNVCTGQSLYRDCDGDLHLMSAGELARRTQAVEERRQMANRARYEKLNRNHGISMMCDDDDDPSHVSVVGTSITGTKKGLVILVEFSDKSMASGHDQNLFDRQFNQEGFSEAGHLGSVHDYFYDQSYGKLELDFDVVGPVKLSQPMSYYGTNDEYGNDLRPATMVIEACKLADQQGVNFSNYDWDEDGEVDQVYVLYAGYGEAYGAASTTIWPHEWNLSSARYYGDGTGVLTLDGTKINTYACSCELRGTSGSVINGIGTACHEFSHCLGFPDFYDTSYAGGFGMYSWDLLDGGCYNGPSGYGEVPCGYTSYERWMAGWLVPTVLNEPETITGMGSLDEIPDAYILYNDGNLNEYILLENRQNDGWFRYVDHHTSPHGLLAIHVDYDSLVWAGNTPNKFANHQHMTIIPACRNYGALQSSGSMQYYICSENTLCGQVFSGSGTVTELTSTSHANYGGKWYSPNLAGHTTLDHQLTAITEEDGKISFLFDGGVAEDVGERFTVRLNPGSGSCAMGSWTQSAYREQLMLPTAVAPSQDWQFVGWSTQEVSELVDHAPNATIYSTGSLYRPKADVTLYAIYRKATDMQGSYVLDYNEEPTLRSTGLGYGRAVSYTANDGGEWVVKAYKNNGLQLNKSKSASIRVPICPAPINTIVVYDGTARIIRFSTTDYTGFNSPTAIVSSECTSPATLVLSGRGLHTGYLYTTSGLTIVTRVEVYYGGATHVYTTYPDVEMPDRPLGDGNGDGVLDVNDVTWMVDRILHVMDAAEDESLDYLDVNGDGEINVVDVTKLVDKILGK